MRVIDLFAGCGGMSLGFENAGFNVIAAFDNWDAAIKIYESNFSHPIYKKDLSKDDIIQQISDMRPDVIMGGPPCQDYSIAGKRELGKRANLTIKFGEIVIAVKPMWVVFENVYNIERFSTVATLRQMLADAGYGITTQVLDASRCGVPQKRQRFFLWALAWFYMARVPAVMPEQTLTGISIFLSREKNNCHGLSGMNMRGLSNLSV